MWFPEGFDECFAGSIGDVIYARRKIYREREYLYSEGETIGTRTDNRDNRHIKDRQ